MCSSAPDVRDLLLLIGQNKKNTEEMSPKILMAFCVLLFNRSQRVNQIQKGVSCLLAKSRATKEVINHGNFFVCQTRCTAR